VDWPALLLKLSHVGLAFLLVAGLSGRWILLSRAARSEDVEESARLADAAAPFERIVMPAGPLVVLAGLVTAWAQGYPWLGLTTGWMLVATLLVVPIVALVPLVFIPRGRAFESAMADARARGVVTAELRAAWHDPAVSFARRYELGATALIIALMVLKPF
jgi:Predicted integral membrane protein (DUF2269)